MADATERRFDSAGREIKSNRAWREEVEALRQQLAESTEVANLSEGMYRSAIRQLAECQAREKVLRDALVRASGYEAYMEDKVITNALALPSDSTALDSAIRRALAESQTFDTWKASPYTTVLEKSIAEDYVPKADIDSALMQAKRDGGREALLEAAVYADEQSNDAKYLIGDYAKGCSNEAASIAIKLRRMAEEMK